MPLITNNTLQTVLDKLTRYAAASVGDLEFDSTFTAGLGVAASTMLTGGNSLVTFINALGDNDVEGDLLSPARDLDENHPTLPSVMFLAANPQVAAMLNAISHHLNRYAIANSLDAYLTGLNASVPTLRAHSHFSKYLEVLSPKNLFIPNDLVVGTFAETGAAAGTYTHVAAVDPTLYGPVKLVVKNTSALTTSASIVVTAKKADGTFSGLTATLSTHTINHETDLSDIAQNYLDATAISMASGGTNGDTFAIVAKTDRIITAI